MANRGFSVVACRSWGIGAVVARSRHSFAKHAHEEIGIGVITEGAQRWSSGGRQFEAGAGAAISVNAGEVHDGAPVSDSGRAWRMLYVDPAVFRHAARDAFENCPGDFELSQTVMPDSRLAALIIELFENETGFGDETRSEELLLIIAAAVGRVAAGGRLQKAGPIGRAKERIDDDPAGQITLAELAALSGLSRFQLLRGFAKATGLTPHAYLVQRRVQLAKRLIASGSRLAEAAHAAGFADQSHMTRIFVRHYGLSPGRYARLAG